MVAAGKSLWKLVWGQPYIDAADLAQALASQAEMPELDYRTRLLIRDGVQALRNYWGDHQLQQWLGQLPARQRIESICREDFDRVGFPAIQERLMDKLDPESVRLCFRALSQHLSKPVRLLVGGSIALIVPGYLERATGDIDIVDEVPTELRNNHKLLDSIRQNYGLELAHFQSHYLPTGWDQRLHFFESFGSLQVYFVDVYDIFLGKLTSSREKDGNDLRVLAPTLEKETLVQRLRDTMASTFATPALRERAEKNWYVIFGENLPYDSDTATSS